MRKYKLEITSYNINHNDVTINYIDENGIIQEWFTDLCENWCNHLDRGETMDYIEVEENDGDESLQVIWKK